MTLDTSNISPARVDARDPVAPDRRPVSPSPASVSLTFAWRTVLKLRHVPEQLTDVVAVPVIFTVLFTYLFGGALAGSTGDYLQFLLPGTLAMTVVMVTMYTGVGVNTDIATGVLDRFRAMPVWRPAPIVGALIGDVGRYLVASAVVLALGTALGYRPDGGAAGVIAAVALILAFAFGLSWLWTVLGLVMRSPQAVMSTGFLIQFPLTLASNVFVEPDTMPGWLQAVVEANPVSHLVTAVRGLMGGTPVGGEVGWVLIASLTLVTVFAPLTMRLYRTRL